MKNIEIFYSTVSGCEKLYVNSREGHKTVDIEKILFCEADGNYTKVLSEGGNSFIICKSLCEFEKQLKSYDFLRCHHSYLISLKRTESFCRRKRFVAVAEHGIPVSRRRCQGIFRVLTDFGIKETNK